MGSERRSHFYFVSVAPFSKGKKKAAKAAFNQVYTGLILIFIEEKVLFRGIVRPYLFDAFIDFAFVLYQL